MWAADIVVDIASCRTPQQYSTLQMVRYIHSIVGGTRAVRRISEQNSLTGMIFPHGTHECRMQDFMVYSPVKSMAAAHPEFVAR